MTDDGSALARATADLEALAVRINAEHRQAEAHAVSAVEHAAEAGRLLVAAKAGCAHGTWLPWLEANVAFSVRRAQEYMKVARHWDELVAKNAGSAHLSIDGALRMLAEPDDPADGPGDPGNRSTVSLGPTFIERASPEVNRVIVRQLAEDPSPEVNRVIVRQLAEDPDVRDDWQTRARVQRAIHDGDQRQEQRIRESSERDPVERKIEGWRASIRLTQVVSQLTGDIGRGNASIEDALRRDPSDLMFDITMLPQLLPDLEAQYAQLGENIARLRSFLDTGSTDIDAFLDDVLKRDG